LTLSVLATVGSLASATSLEVTIESGDILARVSGAQ
jgi:hypothetical protein